MIQYKILIKNVNFIGPENLSTIKLYLLTKNNGKIAPYYFCSFTYYVELIHYIFQLILQMTCAYSKIVTTTVLIFIHLFKSH